MPYPKSIKALKKVQTQLELMRRATSDIEIPSDNSIKLAREIFAGMNYAKTKLSDPEISPELKSLCEEYAELRSKYIVRASSNKVTCELRNPSIYLPEDSTPKERIGYTKMVAAGITDALEVIGNLIEHKPDTVHYKDFTEFDDLISVYNYCTNNKYYIISHQLINDGITVTKKETDLAWQPESL